MPLKICMSLNMERIQNYFLWNSSTAKIKHETICRDFQYSGLKNVDFANKNNKLAMHLY